MGFVNSSNKRCCTPSEYYHLHLNCISQYDAWNRTGNLLFKISLYLRKLYQLLSLCSAKCLIVNDDYGKTWQAFRPCSRQIIIPPIVRTNWQKPRNVTNVPQRLVLEMGKAVKHVSTRQRTHRKTFVTTTTTTIILFSSNAALIFNSGRARLESRARYWLSWLNFRWFPQFPSAIYRDGVSNRSRQLPSSPFPIHHSSIFLQFYAAGL